MTTPTEQDSERGFTLVELLIYSLLLIIVLGIVGAMLASTVSTSKSVNSVTSASTAAQLASESVVRGIRNASDFRLTTPTGTDQLLVARTALGGATINWGLRGLVLLGGGRRDDPLHHLVDDDSPADRGSTNWLAVA